MNSDRDPKELLAFCHIEKAAGTSLTHVLRRAFFLRYAAVRPMHCSDSAYFTARDLRTVKRHNPFLLGIGGHSVVPHSDLVHGTEQIRFITQVRDPVRRAASQYRFWVKQLALDTRWEAFLEHPASKNFQVKKIAGCEDLDLAKENIAKYFLLAGTVEDFDEFLVLLAKKLNLPLTLFTYNKKNVDSDPQQLKPPQIFFDELRERNRLDQQLYDWIRNEVFPGYVSRYPGSFGADVATFRALQPVSAHSSIKAPVDFIYRNAYLKPISGLLRLINGLPYQGSYSRE